MNARCWLVAGCLAALPPGAHAQDIRTITNPPIGKETIVPAGGELFSTSRMLTVDGARLDADAKAGDWLLERSISAGTPLVPVSTKAKYKGCVPYPDTLQADGPCFLDDDGDGIFDRQAGDQAAGAWKLKTPVPYSFVPVTAIRADSFKRTILYQGATADSIRFSYREFTNDMARPAFTEELTVPRETFPSMIMLKNLQIEIQSLTGMGLRYKIVSISQ